MEQDDRFDCTQTKAACKLLQEVGGIGAEALRRWPSALPRPRSQFAVVLSSLSLETIFAILGLVTRLAVVPDIPPSLVTWSDHNPLIPNEDHRHCGGRRRFLQGSFVTLGR